MHLRSDSALYSKDVVEFCEEGKWTFTITADQTGPLMKMIEALPESAWKKHPKDESLSYGEVQYQPVKWAHSYRYLVRREKKASKGGQSALFEVMSFRTMLS